MGLQAILSCHQALFFAPVIKDVQGHLRHRIGGLITLYKYGF